MFLYLLFSFDIAMTIKIELLCARTLFTKIFFPGCNKKSSIIPPSQGIVIWCIFLSMVFLFVYLFKNPTICATFVLFSN